MAKTYEISFVSAPQFTNYQVTKTENGFLNIRKKELTITAENCITEYGKAAPTFTVKYDGFVYGQTASVLRGTLSFDCDYSAGDNELWNFNQ